MQESKKNNKTLKVFRDMLKNQIEINEVIYLEAKINYTILYTKDKSFTSSRPLKSFEKTLDPNNFIRIHKSLMVNISFIDMVIYIEKGVQLKLSNGLKLAIARRRVNEIRQVLMHLNIT